MFCFRTSYLLDLREGLNIKKSNYSNTSQKLIIVYIVSSNDNKVQDINNNNNTLNVMKSCDKVN